MQETGGSLLQSLLMEQRTTNSLLEEMNRLKDHEIRLQEQTNMLLAALVDALAEEQVDDEAQTTTYMDGSPV